MMLKEVRKRGLDEGWSEINNELKNGYKRWQIIRLINKIEFMDINKEGSVNDFDDLNQPPA